VLSARCDYPRGGVDKQSLNSPRTAVKSTRAGFHPAIGRLAITLHQAAAGIGDDELHGVEPAIYQVAQEGSVCP